MPAIKLVAAIAAMAQFDRRACPCSIESFRGKGSIANGFE